MLAWHQWDKTRTGDLDWPKEYFITSNIILDYKTLGIAGAGGVAFGWLFLVTGLASVCIQEMVSDIHCIGYWVLVCVVIYLLLFFFPLFPSPVELSVS